MAFNRVSNRTQDQAGCCTYHDATEAEFVFLMWSMSLRLSRAHEVGDDGRSMAQFFDAIDMPSIDSFLEDHIPRLCDEDRLQSLLELRDRSFSTYKAGNFDLALALIREVHRTCEMLGYMAAAGPLAAKASRRDAEVKQFQEKGAAARVKYTDADRKLWRDQSALLPSIKSASGRAKHIAKKLGLPDSVLRTMRDEIGGPGKVSKPKRVGKPL